MSRRGLPINQAAPISMSQALPRARGQLDLVAKRRGNLSVIGDLRQAGSMKVLFPRGDAATLDAVFLNTAGGMTGGDKFDISANAQDGSRMTLTSQAAERVYGSVDTRPAKLSTRLAAGAGSRVDWLPQETILFDTCALQRKLDVDLASDASCLIVEPLVFGRRTMGETVSHGMLSDDVRVRRDGKLIFADAVRLSGDIDKQLQGAAVTSGGVAMASVLYTASDAEAHLAALQDMMPETGGVSLIRDGVLFARLLADDSFLLRQTLCPIIAQLHGGALPKTWML